MALIIHTNHDQVMLSTTTGKQHAFLAREAGPSDAKTIITLIEENLSSSRELAEYYSTPTVKGWNSNRDRQGDKFLQLHVIAERKDTVKEAEIAVKVDENKGKKAFIAGCARYVEWHARGIPCGYIRGPWISKTIIKPEERLSCGKFIVEKLAGKMRNREIPLARAQVPLFYRERLDLLKYRLGFTVLDRIYTYSREIVLHSRFKVDLAADCRFSRYRGLPGEDEAVITLHNSVFPREGMSREALAAIKREHGGFDGDSTIILLWKGEELAGMAWMDYRADQKSGKETCWIHDLAVAPAFRRQGLGKALVQHCVNTSYNRAAAAAASISEENAASIRTFSGCDFVKEEKSGMELLEKQL